MLLDTYLCSYYAIWPGTRVCGSQSVLGRTSLGIPAEQVWKETYLSIKDDVCHYSDEMDGLMPGTIKSANGFWVGTHICVPDSPNRLASAYKETYYSLARDACSTTCGRNQERYQLRHMRRSRRKPLFVCPWGRLRRGRSFALLSRKMPD